MASFFLDNFKSPLLEWFHEPNSWVQEHDPSGEREGSGGGHSISEDGSELYFRAPAKKDFWSKTFYEPLLVKSDASGLLAKVPANEEATVGIDFEFNPLTQFDQAGLLVYLDDEHWMKCGIEFCDGSARLSVVVCNEFSDWSTQPWPTFSVRLRVHKVLQSSSVVVEAAPLGSEDFQFIRIAHLGHNVGLGEGCEHGAWKVGPYAACPIAQKGCEVRFQQFSVTEKLKSQHDSNLESGH